MNKELEELEQLLGPKTHHKFLDTKECCMFCQRLVHEVLDFVGKVTFCSLHCYQQYWEPTENSVKPLGRIEDIG